MCDAVVTVHKGHIFLRPAYYGQTFDGCTKLCSAILDWVSVAALALEVLITVLPLDAAGSGTLLIDLMFWSPMIAYCSYLQGCAVLPPCSNMT